MYNSQHFFPLGNLLDKFGYKNTFLLKKKKDFQHSIFDVENIGSITLPTLTNVSELFYISKFSSIGIPPAPIKTFDFWLTFIRSSPSMFSGCFQVNVGDGKHLLVLCVLS